MTVIGWGLYASGWVKCQRFQGLGRKTLFIFWGVGVGAVGLEAKG